MEKGMYLWNEGQHGFHATVLQLQIAINTTNPTTSVLILNTQVKP